MCVHIYKSVYCVDVMLYLCFGMYTYVSLCIHKCVCVCTLMIMYVSICVCVYLSVCMYVCM